ncbi:type II toxin-antitoxin system VapC family toxin [Pseudanabaena mucicola]|uniref:Type II toxin-antitoxin system VapC family toxin n=1 Tax=Pseudanabaena mucicola FACHB-723 TaxID=2692860 RepID=A0ABR7ZZ86_9CYAN|nr:PIN domain-containing protein [Pseudanabaena mucicola]MBD2189187.1 type II toxin-antitoxin system VapC family toxin [Pseudanabaena mucicola FACHB-723]
MKLLLDTHIWLWYLLADNRLSGELQSLIANPTTELWLSPISIWETVILAEKRRISLQPNTNEWINLSLQKLETREAVLNHEIAILSREIALPHQDPADRFIAATAIFYKLTLATVDQNLTGFSWLQAIS